MVHPLDLSGGGYATRECYEIVRKILEVDGPAIGLAGNEIAADITGGTKVMTAAMVLACDDAKADVLEHVPATFQDGKPLYALTPIQIVIGSRVQRTGSETGGV